MKFSPKFVLTTPTLTFAVWLGMVVTDGIAVGMAVGTGLGSRYKL